MRCEVWRHFLAGVALIGGVAASGSATAGQIAPAAGSDQRAEQIFASSTNLTSNLSLVNYTDPSCCAPDGCDLGCGDYCGEGCCAPEDDCSGIEIGGWVQFGYHNGLTPNSTARNDGGSFNNHPHRFNLHQGWLYAEKVADGSCGLDWGFRADIMYGVDASDTQSFGNPPGSFDNAAAWDRGAGYGWAMPQLYGEIASGDWSLKLGHFYTLIGYEVVTAPDNFFYSHALTMYNSEPFTHTGALLTYAAGDATIYAGWTAGWDTGFDNFNGGSSWLGGFAVPMGDNVTFTYISTAGNFGARAGGPDSDGYSHSLLFDVAVTDNLNYIFQSDVVRWGTDDDVGINQYLIYSINDKIGVGTRVEWWKNEGASQYAATFGVNVRPMDNLILRPEIRHDWHLPGTQTTFGMDAILTF
ncbi:MAG: porin [Fuerstiella sp.]